MNIAKPKFAGVVRPLCPVCGKPSYSREGVHPQCSMRNADVAARALLRVAGAPLPVKESP
jgi:hypothetical protein